MPPGVPEALAAIGKVGDHEEGAVLVRAGAPCPALGVIVSGRIAIRPPIPGLGRRTILTLEDGDIFGWSAVLAGSTATSDAVAVAPTRVILFERGALTAALEADPRLAAAVYERVLSDNLIVPRVPDLDEPSPPAGRWHPRLEDRVYRGRSQKSSRSIVSVSHSNRAM